MPTTFDSTLTGRVNTTLGPLFGVPVTTPLAVPHYTKIGFDADDRMGWYYAFRSAPLGRATAETVISTFFNFRPERIRQYVPQVWDIAEPAVVIDTLMDLVDSVMGDALSEMADSAELRELAALLTTAAATAFTRPEGRPLFAGIAAIPWPDAPPAQVWLGMHALREFRGDGHVALLTSHDLTALEALVLHAGMGIPTELLRTSRGWPSEAWDATVDDLRSRGLLEADDVKLSEEGAALRGGIERRTDDLAMPAYTEIGEDGVRRILELAPPIVAAVTSVTGRA